MKIPSIQITWKVIGLLMLLIVLAACERPVPEPDLPPSPTPADPATLPTAVPTLPPIAPTQAPEDVQPTPVPPEDQPTPVPPDPGGGDSGQQGETTHAVAPGDTLYNISDQYGVPMEDIMAANPEITDPNNLTVGEQIIIPAPGSGETTPPSGGTDIVYTVKPGDNLFRIGLQYGCAVDQVAGYNGIPAPYTIYPGDQIKIPPDC
ncbi:MAG: LysM peptidoglycan-binding domain-containing protein [Chloroflexi bacterium]|nr:LysM peptidoglycan-binding domain-containing protein [Chloroflexota bacterium]